MNTSLSWIKKYVPDLDVTAREYADAMTMSGTKVENFEELDRDLKDIVVGEVLTCEPHPNSDHLHICTVNVGKGEPLQIVCGAPNVAAGQKVPVVLEGGRVAGGRDGDKTVGGIEIKAGKLRGVESHGMICSIEELGSSHEMYPEAPEYGIYVFPEDTEVGADAIELLGLHDAIIEYEITSNRVDCYSVIGIAREAAATFRKKFCPPVVTPTGNDEDAHDYVKVTVKDPDLCRRYCARVVKNIHIAPSPEWMQRRLAAAGIRPINNLVDITNYVMEEYGQPMHAFDYDHIAGHEIIVRRAAADEKFVTLDGQERQMDENEKDRIRYEVLSFANECRRHIDHTKEEFDHIIAENHRYEDLVKQYDVKNEVYTEAYDYIKRIYRKRMDRRDFLTAPPPDPEDD